MELRNAIFHGESHSIQGEEILLAARWTTGNQTNHLRISAKQANSLTQTPYAFEHVLHPEHSSRIKKTQDEQEKFRQKDGHSIYYK